MAMRKAIVSRHLTLSKSRHSLYGVVLIEGEIIDDVVVVDNSIPVSALLDKYSDWNPEDFEDFYVCPGLIDTNVRSNGPWEGRTVLTKAAISGGVTLIVEQPNVYGLDETQDERLSCDVGASFLVTPTNYRDIPTALANGVMAIKGYLSPPSGYIDGIDSILPEIMDMMLGFKAPLFLDASEPSRRHVFMASPCRYKMLEDREMFDGSSGSNFFAGAFPDEAEDSDKEEEMLAMESLGRTTSDAGMFNTGDDRKSMKLDFSPQPPVVRVSTMITREFHPQPPPPPPSNIYKDLDKRIMKSSATTEDLADLEYRGYHAEGPTTYEPQKRRSSSFATNVGTSLQLDDSLKDRLQGFRPAALTLNKVNESPVEQNENEYLFFLANYPDRWERKGVERVTNMLRYVTCRVHFTNLASANAVNHVRKYRETTDDTTVTCETCPHYLYWASDHIQDGWTILKTAPAIRNKSNKQLLWELLKVKAIDMISSHHCPVAPRYKFVDSGSFRKAVPGVCGLGFSLQAVWTRLMEESASSEEQEHYLIRLSKWMSAAPAKLLGLSHQRGSIEKGKYADLVIWAPRDICTQDSLSLHPEMNPYCGEPLFGRVHRVFLRGQIAFDHGMCFPVGRRELKTNSYSQ